MPYDADQPEESTKRSAEDVDVEAAQRQELPSSQERRPGPKAIRAARQVPTTLPPEAQAERGAYREDIDKEFDQLKGLAESGTIWEMQQKMAALEGTGAPVPGPWEQSSQKAALSKEDKLRAVAWQRARWWCPRPRWRRT